MMYTAPKRGPVSPAARRGGFTLVETLVAIAIITIAVVGPLLTASRTLIEAYTARDQLTASYLASEAIEYVRSMRDTMYLANYSQHQDDTTLSRDSFCDFEDADPVDDCVIQPVNSGASVGSCVGSGDGTTLCTLADPLLVMGAGGINHSMRSCSLSNGCPVLYLNNPGTNSARYTTTAAGTPTTFIRTIQFYIISQTELEVQVTVSWKERGVSYSTSLSDYLSAWQ